MCGIFGIWKTDGGAVDLDHVVAATSTLRHRGPDDEGYLLVDTRSRRQVPCAGSDTDPRLDLPSIREFRNERFDLALGFRRLSILDLSPRGHQPMSTPDRQLWIVFNGEVYNHADIRAQLSGFEPRSDTDTEVVLAAYQRDGPGCLGRFNGMWAIAIWDAETRRLFLSRDRLGVKPLHYRAEGAEFAFASEIKALVGGHGRPFEPDRRAVFDYLVNGLLPDPVAGDTFFAGIRALPAGTWMSVGGPEAPRPRKFWTLDAAAPGPARPAAQVIGEFQDLFRDAVRLRLAADVRVGSCLSGGLDSSAIVHTVARLVAEQPAAARAVGARQMTFSAVYPGGGRIDESAHVNAVLHGSSAEASFVEPALESLTENLRRIVWHQEEPFGSTSVFAQWCVMALARERGAKVLLDGQGADELLGGYGPHGFHLADLAARGLWAELLREASAIRGSRIELASQVALACLPARFSDALRRLKAARTQDLSVLAPSLAAEFRGQPRLTRWSSDRGAPLSAHLREILEVTSLPHLLRYEDRNSMAHGIESRLPFLDYRLVELCFGAAAPWRLHRGWTKWILRKALEDSLPREIAWRTDKVAFETPEGDWLKSWRNLVPELLQGSPRCASFLDAASAVRTFDQRVAHRKSLSVVWRWINLSTWLSVWDRA